MAGMMEDPNSWGAAEPIRQSIHELVHTIGTHLGLIPSDAPSSTPDHDKAIADMNKAANDKSVQDANASYVSAAAAAKIRQKANGK